MIKEAKKIAKLGIKAVSITKGIAEREIKYLMKTGVLPKKDGFALLLKIMKEAEKQSKGIEKTLRKLAKRVLR